MEISAPEGTEGRIVVPFSGKYSVGDKTGLTGDAVVHGGSDTVRIFQE